MSLQGAAVARKAVTGDEFFQRYPTLHGFLLGQLDAAVQELHGGAPHPSLYPVLVLLSRLRQVFWVQGLGFRVKIRHLGY